ncbi:MAG: pyridoxal-phosphate dependent enzyme [Bacteroidales bacterium]
MISPVLQRGNKTRKLDYLIQDAVGRGCDSIVTFGSSQSNWCRMTAAAAGRCGLDAYLFLAGREPARATANLVLDRLAGAHIEHIDSSSESDLVQACTEERKD